MSPPPWPDVLPEVFRGTQAVAQGILTPTQLRNRRRLVPVFHDVYRPSSVPLTHELRCRGAALVFLPGTVLTGASLATLRGVPLAAALDPVTALARVGRRHRVQGIAVRESAAPPPDGGTTRGVPVTTPERMVFDLAARQPLELAVAHLDAVAHAGLVDLEHARRWARGRFDDGVVGVREALAASDARAESVPESRCRVRLHAAGFPVVPQVVVRDGRGFVARVDLALEERRLAVEHDGAWHGGAEQVARDRRRLNRLREAGWTVVHVTAEHLRVPHALVDTVRRALTHPHEALPHSTS